MATAEESSALQAHLETCEPCQRQLQSLISVRNLLAGRGPVQPPADLALETRVRLSHARSRRPYDRLTTRINNVLKPLAVPAFAGVTVTFFAFALLFGNLFSGSLPSTENAVLDSSYRHVQTTARLGVGASPDLEDTLSIDTHVSDLGRPYDYRIISGTRSADVDRWVQEMLLLAQFRPATSFGIPVQSRIILTFVNVRA
jgi:hypothetical protein